MGVELAFDCQTGLGCGGRYEVHDDVMRDQRFPTPVLRDEGKKSMFYFIPFTSAGGQVTDVDWNRYFIGQFL